MRNRLQVKRPEVEYINKWYLIDDKQGGHSRFHTEADDITSVALAVEDYKENRDNGYVYYETVVLDRKKGTCNFIDIRQYLVDDNANDDAEEEISLIKCLTGDPELVATYHSRSAKEYTN